MQDARQIVVQPEHAALGEQARGRAGVARLGAAGEQIETRAEPVRHGERHGDAVHRGLDQRRLRRRGETVFPVFLQAIEAHAVDEIRAGGAQTERHA